MSEERAQQLMQQMQMLETYFADLSQREGTLYGVLREATAAIESIKSLNKKSDSDTLVPVGMGTFVKTKISSNDKIVLNIGAGISIEKDAESAINYLEARIKEIEVAIQDTAAKKHDAAAQLEQGKSQINQLIQADSQAK
ncbi:MAG: prefoldin subunit alpha [Nitrosopumilaceae archaeon]|jgi:prefoldin alpha subunit|uniref:Prefoldin subunit alpha n=2 Tax=Candidatus Nitrosomaritimum aestuariumsis TaxID=3342354 RepID=A0AC60VYM2_9ARCH|nr:prefoldin subunit alpha [Nitrosopumilaceae archaeon]MBA4460423.1 prefoldin subunit alpha [Nitrosopumilaceae archaeon]MBA4462191.1 prefoldin subunit alpha [Nitrosopumilaceae archaeon]MBA4464011.1 prefoldin subunit alpha [Nitrosopumilaceae archaeon]NCF21780.1 prefoldin subunit alpha [Nitrosopumilaceae archaeon]